MNCKVRLLSLCFVLSALMAWDKPGQDGGWLSLGPWIALPHYAGLNPQLAPLGFTPFGKSQFMFGGGVLVQDNRMTYAGYTWGGEQSAVSDSLRTRLTSHYGGAMLEIGWLAVATRHFRLGPALGVGSAGFQLSGEPFDSPERGFDSLLAHGEQTWSISNPSFTLAPAINILIPVGWSGLQLKAGFLYSPVDNNWATGNGIRLTHGPLLHNTTPFLAANVMLGASWRNNVSHQGMPVPARRVRPRPLPTMKQAMPMPESARRVMPGQTPVWKQSLPAPAPVPIPGEALWSEPAVVSWAPDRIDIVALGPGGNMWHKWFSMDGHWYGWENQGGVLVGPPALASWGSGRLDCFMRGQNDHLWHKWFDGGWHDWEDVGGEVTGPPAAVSWGPNRIDVFARGKYGHLWHGSYDGVWHDWEDLGGDLTSPPAVSSRGPNRLDCFIRSKEGHLLHRSYDGAWHDWEDLGGEMASAPAATSQDSNRIDCFAQGANGHMWRLEYDGAWRSWEDLGGDMQPGHAPAACSWGEGRLDCFILGRNLHVWHKWFHYGWTDWEDLGGAEFWPEENRQR